MDAERFAIVGYAARVPGANDTNEFWDLLRSGRDAVSEIPRDRWNADEYFDTDPAAAGKMVSRRAGFIGDISGFDAPFFGVTPREAELLDPQHRLLLETVWQAVEHSGTAPSALAGTNTGVFMGMSTTDYLCLLTTRMSAADIEAYLGTGTSFATGTGRISYRLGLQGPAVTVDTACSSSLVAVHQACQALRYGECDVALAGGVNLIISPSTMINFSQARMLSPDGRCKTFDAAADGYVRGEGCGVIVVKRLADALRDGDRIRAVIRGSAVNQDGASGGLTVPNGIAQQRVIADALKRAGVTAADVDYLEAHGTGTSLGDPIEVQAAGAVLGAGRDADRPLLIGSVKTNIGHLEAAAGIAGMIKVILSLEHGELPKHLHFQDPSPHIPWDRLAVRVIEERILWERNGRPRIAGVSSFGFSGTNAHVILEEAPPETPASVVGEQPDDKRMQVLALSARTPAALAELGVRYRDWLTSHPEASLSDVCFTAGAGRSHFEHRAALVVNSTASATELLGALIEDRPAPALLTGDCGDPPKTAWLFPGQGSQFAGMARELFDTEPVFAETMTRCADGVAENLEKSLLSVIFDTTDESTLRHTSYAQPALFAVELGLARLWQSWGLEPDVVIGHSVGQYSAACVAGVFGVEDGARLMAERGRLFGQLPAGGRMVAVFSAAERVESCADEFPQLSVAAYNGANTVLSGPAADLERVVARLTAEEIRCDWLDTSHAFHSALLDPVLDEFEAYADRFEFGSPQRTLVCNRTGAVVSRHTSLNGQYWRRHARQPVEFAKSVATLADLGCAVLLEVGPQPVLTAAALRAWPDTEIRPQPIASLRRGRADQRQITEALAQAYVSGHRPDFAAFQRIRGHAVELPTYPFQRRRYWYDEKPGQSGFDDATRTETVRLLESGGFEELAGRLADINGGDPLSVLKSVANLHNQERSTQTIAGDRYEITWEKPTQPGTPQNDGADWLVVTDGAVTVAPLEEALRDGGHTHRIVGLPQSEADETQLEATLRGIATEGPAPRILFIAGLDPDATTPSDIDATATVERLARRVLPGTQRFFRAALAAGIETPLWFVSRGAHQVTGSDTVSPVQSSLWGLARTTSLATPGLWGGIADLSQGGADEWARMLDHIITGPIAEDQIALRANELYYPRLSRRTDHPTAAGIDFRSNATYLVTGGLGAIGLEVADFLASHGAGCVLLTGRRPATEATQERIDAISAEHDCQIRVISADVADPDDVGRLLATIRTALPALAGIVHCAGEYSTASLLNHDSAEIEQALAGKVWGALHLSQAVVGLQLDFFLSISSIAALWGTKDQMLYATANAYLDGLSHWQRQHGIPGITAAFGLWTAGMGDEASRDQLNTLGLHPITPAEALTGMAELIAADAPYGIVARIDWARFMPFQELQRKRPFLTHIAREIPETTTGPVTYGSTPLITELRAAPVQQRTAIMLEYVRNSVSEVTKIDLADIRDDTGFFDLGMDSLMALELHRRLERGCGRQLPVTLAMDHPRIAEAARYLLSDALSLGTQDPKKATPAVASSDARIDEPIAIVGMACRIPGATTMEAFWTLLSVGSDMIREIPDDRFDINDFYDPDPDTAGKIYTRYGGFLDGIDGFDPEFFGISPREAVWMDPQQRLVLEAAWEGLERAGLSPAALRGSHTGVYIGVGVNEYSHVLSTNSVDSIEAQFATGNAISVIAGRVAFALGLEGPAVAVDTACSSSLVAIHQACQALRTGDCDLALAGGVNVLLSPILSIATSRARMLAPDGRCKTFDAAADGYVRSEGCGMLVLKPLSHAVRDGDHIQAVIRSSAVNQDGASGGLTVPNGGAQQRVISAALDRAGVAGCDVDYLEAHGTGTALGDPIEVQAAAAVYGAERDRTRPLLIGSVKTNIGHLESAAGVAGLIKVVLSLQHEMIPQNLHFENPSSHIPWGQLPVRVVDKATPWRANGRPRRAGVSSFGFSGTNAHVLIEEAPATTAVAAVDEPDSTEPAHVLPLSARSPEALTALAARYRDWMDVNPDTDIEDVCFTAGIGRSHFEHRAALVVGDLPRARELLNELAENRLGPGATRGVCGDPPKTAWLFTGQGSQYPGMARDLFDAEPVFAETVTRCAEAIDDIVARPLLDVLLDDDTGETLRHTSFAQPALFAVGLGLARLWQSWGVQPDVLLGHSVGQYTAACVAGVFSPEDGARLVAHRGRLFGALPDGGRMVAVFGDAERTEDIADDFPRVSVAAYNGTNTVLSGPGEDLDALVAQCGGDGIRCTWLDTSHAFHSELLDPALDEFESYAARFDFAVATLPLVCNRTGALLTGNAVDAQYWRRHARQPVQFAESVRTMARLGCSVLMELGPQPTLTAAALQIWPESSAPPKAIASLRKDIDGRRQMTEAVAAVYVAGHRPAFNAVHRRPGRRLELPTYPFQRRSYWPKTGGIRSDGSTVSGLLGSAQDLASGDIVYTSRFSVKTQPWLADHVIYGTVVVPGATFGAMVLAAVGSPATVTDVFFVEPILLKNKDSREVQLTLHQADDGNGWTFQVHSRPYGDRESAWSLNAEGAVASGVADHPDEQPQNSIDAILERLVRVRPRQLFEVFEDNELALGPVWQTSLKSLWVGEQEAVGEIVIGDALAEHIGPEPVHPVLFDLCAGVACAAIQSDAGGLVANAELFLPLRYGEFTLREPMPIRFYCRVRWQPARLDAETQVFDLDFMDPDGRIVGGLHGFTVKRAPRDALLRGLGSDAARLLYGLCWRESPPPADNDDPAPPPGTWMIAGFDELAATLPGSVRFDSTLGVEQFARLIDERPPAGVVWRARPPSSPEESSAEFATRLESEIEHLLDVLHPILEWEGWALTSGLWIVTEQAVATESHESVDPGQAALWGLGRTIIAEQPIARCRLVDIDGSEDSASALRNLLRSPGDEPEVAVRQGKYLVPRVAPWARTGFLPVPRGTDYVLAPTERGAINNLCLRASEVPPPPNGHIQVRVQAAGINFRDVLNVLGLYPGDPGQVGGDFAGVVTAAGPDVTGFEVGQRVFGIMPASMASRVNVPVQYVHPVPTGISSAEAASCITAELTALLSFQWADLQPGERVLIHAATGGVGIAAIQMAQRRGAIVFATASTYKRATLRAMGVQYVYDSRSTDFADQILADTDGAGVDVVLNSLTNEGFIEATVRATAPGGRFAEIAKRDIWSPEQMARLRPDIRYEIVAFDAFMMQQPASFQKLTAELAEGLAGGEIRPLPLELYPISDAKAAFRRMQQARHIGKIVMTIPEPLQPRADRSYLITGGLGALGLHTAGYLAQLGAGAIVLTSRRAPDPETQQRIIELSERYHCRIHTVAADVGDEAQAAELLGWIRSELSPLGGIAHLAGVIDDALLYHQDVAKFTTTLAPKAFGAWHLHRLSAEDDLEFFVMYSSGASVLGMPGQANYAAANAMLDGLAFYRRARGLPATTLNWGPWAQGGMAGSDVARANLGARGLIPLDPDAALNALGEVVADGICQAIVLKANWQRAAKLLGTTRPPILDQVLPTAAAATTGDSALLKQLHEVPVPQRGAFLAEHLQRELQQVLGLAQPPVAASRFLELGMDSLMAVELRNRLIGQFGSAFTISATAVFDYPTIASLAEHLAMQTPKDVEVEPKPNPEPAR